MATISTKFRDHFSSDNLSRIYRENVLLTKARGIDNVGHQTFLKNLSDNINVIERKVIAGTYHFTKYKLKLISRGRGRVPREISIPTVRDRIAIRALCDLLNDIFGKVVEFDLPQHVVKKIKNDLRNGSYTGFIKLDVADFYPSIRHSELATRLRKRIRFQVLLDLLLEALRTPTVDRSRASDEKGIIGIPQGLSISNILAAIYLINIDKRYSHFPEIKYYRYVDDILILCKVEKAHEIAKAVIRRFRRLGLKIHDPLKHPEKSKIDHLNSSFNYLGYKFDGPNISVRQSSVDKLKESLVSIFTVHKHSRKKSNDFLLWRLNLRITGCIFQNKCKGWLFFFSEITDESILHILDRFIERLKERFSVPIKTKRFVRALYQIKFNKYETNYIPNFDEYTLEQKKGVLTEYFSMDISRLTDDEIDLEFRIRIDKQIRDLLTDIQDFGY